MRNNKKDMIYKVNIFDNDVPIEVTERFEIPSRRNISIPNI